MIRTATTGDRDDIWAIIGPVFRAGETYAVDPNISETGALDFWMGSGNEAFVFEEDAEILGTYFMCANKLGGGAHVANCGYITAPSAQGRGVARRMCEHSITHAKNRGFKAIQFNFVVSTNERAIVLWRSLGFETVGRLPDAFKHPTQGYVDVFIMYRIV